MKLTPSIPLRPGAAVAALIHTGDGRYLMQLRDAIPTIFYPDHWGCFGGAMEAGEAPLVAIRRELTEELGFDFSQRPTHLFGKFSFSVEAAGIRALDRHYYDIVIEEVMVAGMRLGEGAQLALLSGDELLHRLRVVPYDAFALWLHRHRGMLDKT